MNFGDECICCKKIPSAAHISRFGAQFLNDSQNLKLKVNPELEALDPQFPCFLLFSRELGE